MIEAVVAIGAGIAAGSIALVGFGFDSTIEVMSSVVVAWQFRGEMRSGYDEARERFALRLIAVSFFVLAAYVSFESVRDLFFIDSKADESAIGIALAALSLIVMPGLAIAKRRTADRLGSPTLRADSRETLLCAWLSAALLAGLVLNAAFGCRPPVAWDHLSASDGTTSEGPPAPAPLRVHWPLFPSTGSGRRPDGIPGGPCV